MHSCARLGGYAGSFKTKGVTCVEGSGSSSSWLHLGAALLVAAGFASPRLERYCATAKGGTMKLNMSATDVDFTDPSLAYGTISWQIEYATALKLYNYPDAKPPVGSQLRPRARPASRSSRTTARRTRSPSSRASSSPTAPPVTAANYAKAINRALNKTMQSPAATFIATSSARRPSSTARPERPPASSVKGNKLVIKLTKPDGGMLAKLGMPFFQAIPLNLPLDSHGVDAYASAGPYYIASRTSVARSCSRRTRTTRASARRTSTRSSSRSTRTSTRACCRSRRPGRLRHGRPARRRRHADLAKSSASTRAATSSTSSSRPTTSL